MRADRIRNRGAIVAAARELLGDPGSELTMDGIAVRAGVAVGTLYRHFPTKTDLVQAVLAETVTELADLAEAARDRVRDGADPWQQLVDFFVTIAQGPSASRTVAEAARALGVADDDTGPVDPAADRAVRALAETLAASRDAGLVRPDVDLADLFLVMVQAPDRHRPAERDRYMQLVAQGLRLGR
ncbi:TetR/AcrR family transcriptional regulator [Klenkia soli]|uniref:TetR/AcrR family transcriptional regulator n=1 Tax=Klenkia soli TaxID=1052260 RepID=UPI0013F4D9B7|nr:TetR/AcrR family transcriptional regulator [Klenkia soli]